jgi:ABC-type hemin transport system ATPase subunit
MSSKFKAWDSTPPQSRRQAMRSTASSDPPHQHQQTQQNAALVEQTAAAAVTLHDQALAFAGRVARFRLPGAAVAARPA